MKAEDKMKIGEVSRRTGVGIEALRFYERSGLLDRPRRTESGYRLYGPDVLDRVAFIKQAQVLGFTLQEIKTLIEEKRDGKSPCAEVREIVRTRLSEIDHRIAELTRYRDDLTDTLREWDSQGEADGHVCGLIENSTIEHPAARKTIS